VGRGQWRAVVKFNPAADFEGVDLAFVLRLRHRSAKIADKVGGRGRVLWIDPDQRAVKWRCRMHGCVSGLTVTIKARWSVGGDHVGKHPALLWRLLGRCCGRPKSSCKTRYRKPHPNLKHASSKRALILSPCWPLRTCGVNRLTV